MKRIVSIAALLGLLAAPAMAAERALFVSMLQRPFPLESLEEVESLVEHASKAGVRTLFVQVYRSNRAHFPSSVADDEPYRTAVRSSGRDPLEHLIRRCHERGIEVHAWMNLLSLSANTEAPMLLRYGAAILARKPSTPASIEDHRVDGQFFLEPSDPRVRRALTTTLGELLRAYPGLDGVQFDYIRYPDWKPFYGYSAMNMRRFRRAHPGANIREDDKAWKDWRRAQVSALLSGLRKKALSIRPGLVVSTTGLVPYSRATHESFQDWKHWLASGYADFVTLMNYAPDAAAYARNIKDGRTHAPDWSRVYLAVGAYRFTGDPAAYARQLALCEEAAARGCAVLDYGILLKHPELMGS